MHPREHAPFYIPMSDSELSQISEDLGIQHPYDVFHSIPQEFHHQNFSLFDHLSLEDLKTHVEELANKNNIATSFIGDGLPHFEIPDIVPKVSNIRGLTTAYTPYQPERGQGTLIGLWLYASAMAKLTGVEAINASLYDVSTALYEALVCATRIKRNKNTILLAKSFAPHILEVLETLSAHTPLKFIHAPIGENGQLSISKYKELLESEDLAAVAFPQVNCLGILEDVHSLTDLAHSKNLLVIGEVDPMLLGPKGLVPPAEFGKTGVDMFVGEGQHLALAPNYGGPGLGIFGIRYNAKTKTLIRSTAGRFVGKTRDASDKECFTLILSTREQHIRREKATSNICSNQSFLATLVGASLLQKGDEGLKTTLEMSRARTQRAADLLTSYEGIQLAYSAPLYNSIAVQFNTPASIILDKARNQGIHLGIDVSNRGPQNNVILMTFTDNHTEDDFVKLENFLNKEFSQTKNKQELLSIPNNFLRSSAPGIPSRNSQELESYYKKLGNLNLSPDDHIYPLGSCTMKYNPYINDYAANLKGFTDIHPLAPVKDAQGSLEVLYTIQEAFKKITGLQAVTTQPVAGAQGELVGLKMFQAYHKDQSAVLRDIIIIPKSAHGTNPATATMAGYSLGKDTGVVLLDATDEGLMDMDHLKALLLQFGRRVAGIMVTNPNTSGLFETHFKKMSELIHSVGGLVYMDGANMNALAGHVNLEALGVDAVHNNLHKTWSIPHGGGGPGDAIVAVSEKLIDYLPGKQVIFESDSYSLITPKKSIGSFHRHFGNMGHKVRCYTYLKALGTEGVQKMSAVAVLSARYLYSKLAGPFPTLPEQALNIPRMHEFIITISPNNFELLAQAGVPKAKAIVQIGKLFLDFGLHTPTVAFPETYGLMIEPTESFSKKELDQFIDIVKAIQLLLNETPEVFKTAPHFTPVARVDEVMANRLPVLSDDLSVLPTIHEAPMDVSALLDKKVGDICKDILDAHKAIQT